MFAHRFQANRFLSDLLSPSAVTKVVETIRNENNFQIKKLGIKKNQSNWQENISQHTRTKI